MAAPTAKAAGPVHHKPEIFQAAAPRTPPLKNMVPMKRSSDMVTSACSSRESIFLMTGIFCASRLRMGKLDELSSRRMTGASVSSRTSSLVTSPSL